MGEADSRYLRLVGGVVNGLTTFQGNLSTANISYSGNVFTMPSSSGQLALVSQIPTSTSYVDLTTNQTVAGIKSFSNQISLANGSVSDPSIRFTNDTNSGIYRNGSGSFDIAISGSRKMTVNSNGLVVRLGHLNLTGSTVSHASSSTTGSAISSETFQITNDPSSSGVNAQYNSHYFGRKTLTATNSTTYTNAYTNFIAGPPNPSTNVLTTNRYSLGIAWGSIINQNDSSLGGQIIFPGGTSSLPAYTFLNDTNTGIYSSVADNLEFSCGGTKTFSQSITQTNLPIAGSVGTPSLYFSTDTTTGFYRSGVDQISVAVSGALLMNISGSGVLINNGFSVLGGNTSLAGVCQTTQLKVGSSGTTFSTFLTGTYTIASTIAVGAAHVQSVSFGITFSSTPRVIACVSSTAAIGGFQNFLVCTVFSITTTGCSINVCNTNTTSSANANTQIVWFAFN